MWTWLKYVIGCDIDLSSFLSVLGVCDRGWNTQIKDIVLAAVLNIFSVIWHCRNKLRFDNKLVPIRMAINMVAAAVLLTGDLSQGDMSSSVSDLMLLRTFTIVGHVGRPPSTKEVAWCPPPCYWIKCNSDGATGGASGMAVCGGIFRDYRAVALGCFATNLGITNSLHAKLIGPMMAIEHASVQGWSNFWLESDSQLAVATFHCHDLVPWKLKTRWLNCLALTRNMNFKVSHIFREGNCCADRLANHGLSILGCKWWDTIPPFLSEPFFRNQFGLPSYRFK